MCRLGALVSHQTLSWKPAALIIKNTTPPYSTLLFVYNFTVYIVGMSHHSSFPKYLLDIISRAETSRKGAVCLTLWRTDPNASSKLAAFPFLCQKAKMLPKAPTKMRCRYEGTPHAAVHWPFMFCSWIVSVTVVHSCSSPKTRQRLCCEPSAPPTKPKHILGDYVWKIKRMWSHTGSVSQERKSRLGEAYGWMSTEI